YEETDDEFVHSEEHVQDHNEETDDEFVHGDEQVNDDEDEEMTNAEDADTRNVDKDITDTAKADAEKTKEVNDDIKKAKLPPSSSSLSINSLLDVQIQQEILHIQSPSVLTVPVSVIPEPSILSPIPEIPSVAPETTLLNFLPLSLPYHILGDALQKAAESLSEYELKNILFGKIDKSFSYLTYDKHQALYDALFNSFCLDDVIARGQADPEKILRKRDCDDEVPSAGPNQGKKTKRSRTKESEPSKKSFTTKESSKCKSPTKTSKFGKSVTAEEPVEEPAFEMASDDIKQTIDDVVNDDDQPPDDTTQTKDKDPKKDWFKQPPRPPTPDPKWNKPQDYAMNRLKIDKLTKAHLVGPVYNILKGTCQSSIELEYNMEECYKALFDKLDWNNPEGDRCLYDLSKPLPLKGRPGRLTVPSEYFFNNNLEYLKSSDLEKKYTTSITKIKAARYELVGIEYMIPNLWSATKVGCDKDAAFGIKHWGPKRQLWYRSQINKFSKHSVYSTQKILSVVSVKINKLHGYGHLEEIVVRRADRQKYTFKEGDFVNLHLNDIEDMLLFVAQHKRVKDVQLGMESYQKKLNLTKPQQDFPRISARELYTPSFDPPGAVYEDLNKQKRVMLTDELYKFSDETLKLVCDELHHRVLNFRLGYNTKMSRRKWSVVDKRISELMVELIYKQM
ncbi:hypothetical protein Tco_1305664, partial [Tanacetum coccineum]